MPNPSTKGERPYRARRAVVYDVTKGPSGAVLRLTTPLGRSWLGRLRPAATPGLSSPSSAAILGHPPLRWHYPPNQIWSASSWPFRPIEMRGRTGLLGSMGISFVLVKAESGARGLEEVLHRLATSGNRSTAWLAVLFDQCNPPQQRPKHSTRSIRCRIPRWWTHLI